MGSVGDESMSRSSRERERNDFKILKYGLHLEPETEPAAAAWLLDRDFLKIFHASRRCKIRSVVEISHPISKSDLLRRKY